MKFILVISFFLLFGLQARDLILIM